MVPFCPILEDARDLTGRFDVHLLHLFGGSIFLSISLPERAASGNIRLDSLILLRLQFFCSIQVWHVSQAV